MASVPKLETISQELQLGKESQTGSKAVSNSIIMRPATEADIESIAQICQDAFAAFNSYYGQPNTWPPREENDLSKQIAEWKTSHQCIEYVVAVSVDSEGNEIEVLGSNGIDLRDSVGGIGIISVKTTSQTQGLGRVLMKSVMEMGQKRGVERMSLMVDGMNHGAFGLYTSLGFNVVEFCVWLDGLVSDEEEEGALQRAEASGITVRRMGQDDVLNCNCLFETSFGFSRVNGIRDSRADKLKDTALVAARATGQGKEDIVGYTTMLNASGHYLAQNGEILEAMIAFGSRMLKSNSMLPSLSFHLMARHNPLVLRWALKVGFRIKRNYIWMSWGKPITFHEDLAYCPDYYF